MLYLICPRIEKDAGNTHFFPLVWFSLQNGSHLWQLALQKRKEGRCPLEPGEVAVILRAMGYPKETQIYVASGQVYGGQNRMAPLRNMFPNLVSNPPAMGVLLVATFLQYQQPHCM